MSVNVEINGIVKEVKDVEEFASGFVKRTVVVEQVDQTYNDEYAIEFLKDKAADAGELKVGNTYSFQCNLNSRYWEKGDRHFTSVSSWKWSEMERGEGQPVSAPADEPGSDLPF